MVYASERGSRRLLEKVVGGGLSARVGGGLIGARAGGAAAAGVAGGEAASVAGATPRDLEGGGCPLGGTAATAAASPVTGEKRCQ